VPRRIEFVYASFPSKLHLRIEDLDPCLIHVSLGQPESTTQTGSRSVQPLFQGSRLRQTDRQTDRKTDYATRSVTVGRTYVRTLRYRRTQLLGIRCGSADPQTTMDASPPEVGVGLRKMSAVAASRSAVAALLS